MIYLIELNRNLSLNKYLYLVMLKIHLKIRFPLSHSVRNDILKTNVIFIKIVNSLAENLDFSHVYLHIQNVYISSNPTIIMFK